MIVNPRCVVSLGTMQVDHNLWKQKDPINQLWHQASSKQGIVYSELQVQWKSDPCTVPNPTK